MSGCRTITLPVRPLVYGCPCPLSSSEDRCGHPICVFVRSPSVWFDRGSRSFPNRSTSSSPPILQAHRVGTPNPFVSRAGDRRDRGPCDSQGHSRRLRLRDSPEAPRTEECEDKKDQSWGVSTMRSLCTGVPTGVPPPPPLPNRCLSESDFSKHFCSYPKCGGRAAV